MLWSQGLSFRLWVTCNLVLHKENLFLLGWIQSITVKFTSSVKRKSSILGQPYCCFSITTNYLTMLVQCTVHLYKWNISHDIAIRNNELCITITAFILSLPLVCFFFVAPSLTSASASSSVAAKKETCHMNNVIRKLLPHHWNTSFLSYLFPLYQYKYSSKTMKYENVFPIQLQFSCKPNSWIQL